jgi:hypothetical protein
VAGALTPEQAERRIAAWERQLKDHTEVVLGAVVKALEPAARKNMAQERIPNKHGAIKIDGPELTLDYTQYPWMAGAEAGSKRHGQFRQYVGFGDRGYIVGRAIRETERVTERAALKAMEKTLEEEL